MSHDRHGYLAYSLGNWLCHLIGTAWAWIKSYGHLTCGLCLGIWNVGWALAVSHHGHRPGMGDGMWWAWSSGVDAGHRACHVKGIQVGSLDIEVGHGLLEYDLCHMMDKYRTWATSHGGHQGVTTWHLVRA